MLHAGLEMVGCDVATAAAPRPDTTVYDAADGIEWKYVGSLPADGVAESARNLVGELQPNIEPLSLRHVMAASEAVGGGAGDRVLWDMMRRRLLAEP